MMGLGGAPQGGGSINPMAPGAGVIAQLAMQLLYAAAWFFATSIEVFFRRDFGERYLNIVGTAAIAFVMAIATLIPLAGLAFASSFGVDVGGGIHAMLFLGFLLGFVVLVIIHQLRIRKRRQERNWIYSYYWGTSHLSQWLPWAPDNISRWVEPGITLILGIVIFRFLSLPFGTYLILCSMALFVKGVINWYQMRNWMLDIIDAWIVADVTGNMRDRNATAAENKGVNFVDAFPKELSQGERNSVVDMIANMNPAYRALMDNAKPDAADAETPAAAQEANVSTMTATLSPELQSLMTDGSQEAESQEDKNG